MIKTEVFRILRSNRLTMSRKKRQNKLLRNKYQITGEELIQQGKLDPYFHLKDLIDMKGEQLENKTDWWSRMSQTS